MIAYHFPPLAGSSGIQRTLRFVQHLPALGWQPLVLSADPRAYERTSDDLLPDVPRQTVVRRAFALDTARHLTIAGRYVAWMARPDRWVSWRFAAVHEGMKLVKEYKPDVLWSTYPIATAHLIGSALHRKTGIPWVADFRDPMAQDGYPADPVTWQAYQHIEADAADQAAFCVFTTPGAAEMYRQRYPAAASRMQVVENGYDEESFASAPAAKVKDHRNAGQPGPTVLLHSGIVYPSERDPTQLFAALKNLHLAGAIDPANLLIRFRASAHDSMLQAIAMQYGVQDFIQLTPAIPYREALAEMQSVDALLVMQASNCNAQIPAKIYEYLRAGRPVIGLTDPDGDTAGVLRDAGLDSVARLDSCAEIQAILPRFLQAVRAGRARLPLAAFVQSASRQGRAGALVQILAGAI